MTIKALYTEKSSIKLLSILAFVSFFSCKNTEDSDSTNDPIKDSVVVVDSMLEEKGIIKQCIYTKLSEKYNYEIKNIQRCDSSDLDCENIAIVIIRDKKTLAVVDSVNTTLSWQFEDVFTKPEERSKSFFTKFNLDALIENGDFGDFIVADFNFDNKEDFAIIYDSGASSGATYNFFIQGSNYKMYLNTFLTDTLRVFPDQFYPKTKRLKSETRSGTCWHFETIYQLKNTSDWRVVSSTKFDDCKGQKSKK
jgi:hypothetical protein